MLRPALALLLLAVLPGPVQANEDPYPCDGPAFEKIQSGELNLQTTLPELLSFLDREKIGYSRPEPGGIYGWGRVIIHLIRIEDPATFVRTPNTCSGEVIEFGYDAEGTMNWFDCRPRIVSAACQAN